MEKRIFDFTDSRLAAGDAALYELGVAAGTDGFSFLVADPVGAVLALKAWHFDNYNGDFPAVESLLRQVLGSEWLLTAAYSRARCAVFNRQATLVPRRLFAADQLPSYLQLLLPAGDHVFGYAELPALDCFLVYALDAATDGLLRRNFPGAQITHLAVGWLHKCHELAPAGSARVFVNLRYEIAQIAVFERRNLLFYNAFNFDTANDFLYFALLAYDQCRLDPQETPLLLTGDLLEESAIYRQLYAYIRHLEFAESPGRYQLPPELSALPAHFFFDLFSLKSI